jgi:hypothetical protein
VGRPEGKRPVGRPRRRWVDDIKIDLGRVVSSDVGWIDLAHDRNHLPALVNTAINIRIPKNIEKFLSS